MLQLLARILVIVLGVFLVPIALITSKEGKFKKCFFWFDNEEDGYTGDKKGFYSAYLGRKVTSWDHYVWSAFRNPAYNLRYAKWFSVDVSKSSIPSFKGNTYHKSYDHSFDKVRKKIWFVFSLKTQDKELTCRFIKIPIGKYDLKLLVGWKLYPGYYLDSYWLNRIANSGWPSFKDRAVFVLEFNCRKSSPTIA